ncbi:NAD+ synthase [uncultured Amnibacterium sp.]|uniref:NAD+ synthase n=1 Tax=uncultured Amnibacterium sp. TaxID=1631851 RepID=UPI0035CAD1EE
MPKLRIALAQTNPVVGDFAANTAAALDAAQRARDAGADLVALGEMALSGYPIEDLATRPAFLAASHAHLLELARRLEQAGCGDLPVVIGFPDGPFEPRPDDPSTSPRSIAQNCAAVLFGGGLLARQAKFHLPNYSVFDEYRNFIPGDELVVLRIEDPAGGDVDVALAVCEDIWRDGGPVSRVASADAGVLLVINASPYERDKDDVRLPLVTRRATETDAVVAYVNIVGGQDDLVFDGDSVVVDRTGTVIARAPQFREHLLVVDVDLDPVSEPSVVEGVQRFSVPKHRRERPPLQPDVAVPPDDLQQVWEALGLGLADYVGKNGFRSVILGLSGGIDSSVIASLAVDRLGPDRVYGVSMPSRYSSGHSRSDADDLAERLGLHYRTEAIEDLVVPFESQLHLQGLAAENIQARARALILMALSNQEGHLVLTTGNKSELSVGYSTIYGDSVGGFAPLKDVPKMLVWELARWRNRAAESRGERAPIPENSISKPPSAELRVDQTDQETLPSYEDLDAILELYITEQRSREQVLAAGYDEKVVDQVVELTDHAEWKRRQSAIGPKISHMAFGRDRRLPITYRPVD